MALLALSSTKKVKDKEKNSIGEETERDGTGEEASRSRVDFDWWSENIDWKESCECHQSHVGWRRELNNLIKACLPEGKETRLLK